MKEIQSTVKEFCTKYNLDAPAEHRLLDIMSELGEVSKEILKATRYGTQRLQYRNEIKDELGDLLFSTIALANIFDIDLKEALDKALSKYEKRLQKGSAGSEVESK